MSIRITDRSQSDILADRRAHRTELIDKLRRGERMNHDINVKITLLPGAELPRYAKPGDSGFDLVAQEDYVVEPGQTVKVRTGICVELPPGTELQVRPRSGISANTKLRVANSPGTGDSSYRGEICVLIDNIAQPLMTAWWSDADGYVVTSQSVGYMLTLDSDLEAIYFGGPDATTIPLERGWWRPDKTYLIRKGERIAQAVIAPVLRAAFEVVTELAESERGSTGFGSSGVTTEGVNAE